MIGMKVTKLFFDRPAVKRAADRGTRKVLNRFGGAVRLTARRSIAKAGKSKTTRISNAGEPPRSHTGRLKGLILYAVDMTRRSVVIGPEKARSAVSADIPNVLEYGGVSTVEAFGKRGKRVKRKVNIEARPFMGPAFQKIEPKLPSMWADSVK